MIVIVQNNDIEHIVFFPVIKRFQQQLKTIIKHQGLPGLIKAKLTGNTYHLYLRAMPLDCPI